MSRTSLIALSLVSWVACSSFGPSAIVDDMREELARADRNPLAACGFCADVSGRNDAKKLCGASVLAWYGLVDCTCNGPCAGSCAADWCSRLDDLAYTNASDPCNDCIVASCWPELLACSGAM